MNKNYHVITTQYLEYQLYTPQEYIKEQLDKLNIVINSITDIYKRVLYIRFDLKFPKESKYCDEAISKFFTKLKKRLITKKYNQKNAAYLWTREKKDSDNPHYHCVLFLDYNKARQTGFHGNNNSSGVMGLVSQLWCETLNTDNTGLIYLADRHKTYKYINRDNPKSKQEIFKHCAYLCKLPTKAFDIAGKNIGYSQVKPKHQK
ncbi:inovirus-type Gp2 protein [Vibrio vulnificus]|nr:inovirus-type Gp2 protein [Vibrio vulnificus]